MKKGISLIVIGAILLVIGAFWLGSSKKPTPPATNNSSATSAPPVAVVETQKQVTIEGIVEITFPDRDKK